MLQLILLMFITKKKKTGGVFNYKRKNKQNKILMFSDVL